MERLVASPIGVPISAAVGPVVRLVAPLAGWLVPQSEVPDPVFADRILGDGFAIDPTETTLRAPFDGVVTSIHRARHAVTLRADNGAEILMHVGLDTVGLKGEGFTAHVAQGDRVVVGAPLIDFDMDAMAPVVKSLVVPIVLTNGDGFSVSEAVVDRKVGRGDALIEITAAAGGTAASVTGRTGEVAVRRSAKITDPAGIHARPAGLLSDFAKSHAARITVRFADREADAESPVALMLLGAQFGDVLAIEVTGVDAEAAATGVVALLGTEVEPIATSAVVEPPPVPLAPPFEVGTVLALTGITAAPGLAVGQACRLVETVAEIRENGIGVEREQSALAAARALVHAQIEATIADLGGRAGPKGEILAAHLSFLEDPRLGAKAYAAVEAGKSAAFAWASAIDAEVAALRALGKPLLAERAADLLDIRRRVLSALSGKSVNTFDLPVDAVLFADDLPPSQFADLDATRLVGLVLAAGGPTSHVAILAASAGIPTIVAAGPDTLRIPDGATVVLDADAAQARINPPADEVAATRRAVETRRSRAAAAFAAAALDCRMADGTRIEVVANIGSPRDVAAALAHGAEGCGLMRSEFLFLDRTTAPSEDEQLAHYRAIATALQGRPLIIRTLDAGADKRVPYADLPDEDNPALGTRGIRLGLARPDLLRTQIRAVLRVEPFGHTRIMMPMVATLDELRRVREMIAAETIALGRTMPIEVGIMVEVPSVALIADRFAAEADFFSIGTNDLAQYTLAMDRGNPRFAGRIDPLHPAVLRLIALAAEGAAAHGRPVGVCGTLASQPTAAAILIGLGVTELSATPGAIPAVKALVRTLTPARCAEIARDALRAESAEAVRRLLAAAWPDA